MKYFVFLFLLSIGLFAFADELEVVGDGGNKILRIVFDAGQPGVDQVSFSPDKGRTWNRILVPAPIDTLRVRSAVPLKITGTIPDRVTLETMGPSNPNTPQHQEIDLAAGPLLYKYNEKYLTGVVIAPRPDGIFKRMVAKEVLQRGGEHRDSMYVVSIETSLRTVTWLVRQMGWKAGLINFQYESDLSQIVSELVSGERRHLQHIHTSGFDFYDIDKAMKLYFPNFEPDNRFKKISTQQVFFQELRKKLQDMKSKDPQLSTELALTSIAPLKHLIRELEESIGFYDVDSKRRVINTLLDSFEKKLKSRPAPIKAIACRQVFRKPKNKE